VPTATSAAASEIVFRKSGKTVKCTIDDAILDVAESNGIAYESSCRAGTCGTCKTKKIEGTVHLDEQQVLSEADISEGFILACVGRAEGRVVLDA
jgi:ferredoxin